MYELKHIYLLCTLLVFVMQFVTILANVDLSYGQNWPQWRGPHFSGACPDGNPPVEWNENKNIKWKVVIPGKGFSTPVIWGDQIFLTTTVETDREENLLAWLKRIFTWENEEETVQAENIHAFIVLSVDRHNGKIIWQRKVREQLPLVKTHFWGSWASNSMVTDGEAVYAYFGSHGLYCLDLQGNILWQRDLSKMDKDEGFGEGSSPALYENTLVILRDHEGQSKLITIDKRTGDILWEMNRDTNTSWSTPLVVTVQGKPQIITTATNMVQSYDLHSGNLIWEYSGFSNYPIATPVPDINVVYVMNGFEGNIVMAIRPEGLSGKIAGSKSILWTYTKTAPYTPSALLVNGLLYFLNVQQGKLTCLDAKTGNEYYSDMRLRGTGTVVASPVGTNERIYIVGLKGRTHVIKHGPEFQVLAVNKLDDNFAASPAIVGDYVYLRGIKQLYCIAQN